MTTTKLGTEMGPTEMGTTTDWIGIVRALGPTFAERAAEARRDRHLRRGRLPRRSRNVGNLQSRGHPAELGVAARPSASSAG